jgi:hypothetical protein
MPLTATNVDSIEQLPIRVLELHIHDEDVCRNCGWPPALNGFCTCTSFEPVPSLFAVTYLDTRATRAANGLAPLPAPAATRRLALRRGDCA